MEIHGRVPGLLEPPAKPGESQSRQPGRKKRRRMFSLHGQPLGTGHAGEGDKGRGGGHQEVQSLDTPRKTKAKTKKSPKRPAVMDPQPLALGAGPEARGRRQGERVGGQCEWGQMDGDHRDLAWRF